MEKLLALGPDLSLVLVALANEGNITDSQIEKARTGLPSFSAAQWSELAPIFDLPPDLTMSKFPSFSIAAVLLPPSFHETSAEAAWRVQDVYQERLAQEREEVRLRVFDAVWPALAEFFFACSRYTKYLIPIVGLFQGRIIDKPEHSMTSTSYSSGGEVEHAVSVLRNIC